MRIAFLSRYQNSIDRGAETFVRELSLRFKEKHSVDILSGKDADSLLKIILGKYDMVISINGRLQALKASLGRFFSPYKLVIPGQSGIGGDVIWNTAIVQPNIFVALTDYMANWAKKWAWNSKIIKIPNGVDLVKFRPDGVKINFDLEKPIVLSVGALVWYKYHDRVIEAVSKLEKGSVLIVGEGPLKEQLTKMGNKMLGDRFKIASFKYQDIPKVYRSCDLFTLPSWDREAFGIVHLEAMASGLGVVAPDDPPRREIVGYAGIFVDVSASNKYAQAIEVALRIDWQKKAKKQAEKFSWEIVANQYKDLLENL